jgi:hypothetical protein
MPITMSQNSGCSSETESTNEEILPDTVLSESSPGTGAGSCGERDHAAALQEPQQSRCSRNVTKPLPSLATGRNEPNLILPNDSQEVGMFCLPSRPSRKTEDERERIKQEMAQAVAAYRGPIVKCPPGRAMGSSGQNEADLELLTRPRFRASGGLKTG